MKKLIIPVFLMAASVAPVAQANQTLCVYDLLGSAGDMVKHTIMLRDSRIAIAE